MLLTDQERQRFVAYCLQESHDYRLIAEHMATLPSGDVLTQRPRALAAAYEIIARHLGDAEPMSIGAEDPA